jgi:hypothetical protein
MAGRPAGSAINRQMMSVSTGPYDDKIGLDGFPSSGGLRKSLQLPNVYSMTIRGGGRLAAPVETVLHISRAMPI